MHFESFQNLITSPRAQISSSPERSQALSVADNGGSHSDLVPSAEKASPEDLSQDPQTVRPVHGWKWVAAVVALYSTAFLYGLNTTIAADIQPEIIRSLRQIQKLTWIGSGFPLGSVATILPIRFAYGLFNIKHFYIISVILFEIGSAICGAAPTMDALIVGRVIAGSGGAGMYLGALNYLSIFTTIRERSLCSTLRSGLGNRYGLRSSRWRRVCN